MTKQPEYIHLCVNAMDDDIYLACTNMKDISTIRKGTPCNDSIEEPPIYINQNGLRYANDIRVVTCERCIKAHNTNRNLNVHWSIPWDKSSTPIPVVAIKELVKSEQEADALQAIVEADSAPSINIAVQNAKKQININKAVQRGTSLRLILLLRAIIENPCLPIIWHDHMDSMESIISDILDTSFIDCIKIHMNNVSVHKFYAVRILHEVGAPKYIIDHFVQINKDEIKNLKEMLDDLEDTLI